MYATGVLGIVGLGVGDALRQVTQLDVHPLRRFGEHRERLLTGHLALRPHNPDRLPDHLPRLDGRLRCACCRDASTTTAPRDASRIASIWSSSANASGEVEYRLSPPSVCSG